LESVSSQSGGAGTPELFVSLLPPLTVLQDIFMIALKLISKYRMNGPPQGGRNHKPK
jgi:hypothetical protein